MSGKVDTERVAPTFSGKDQLEEDFENDFEIGTSVATSSATVRVGFLKKVYGIVSVQLLATVLISLLVMFSNPIRGFVLTAAYPVMLCMLGSVVTFFLLLSYRTIHPTNMYLLATFTLFESYTVGWVCAINYESGLGHAVAIAFVLTCAVFLSLTAFCLMTKKDFSFLGGFLFASLVILLFSSVITLVFGFNGKLPPVLNFMYSFFGSLVFCGYILFDTSLMMHHLSPDEYILAAINIYLDIINLFLHILRAMSNAERN